MMSKISTIFPIEPNPATSAPPPPVRSERVFNLLELKYTKPFITSLIECTIKIGRLL